MTDEAQVPEAGGIASDQPDLNIKEQVEVPRAVFVSPTAPSLSVPIDVGAERVDFQFKNARLELSGEELEAFEGALKHPKAVALRQLVRRVSADAGAEIVRQHQAMTSREGAVKGAFDSTARLELQRAEMEGLAGNVAHAGATNEAMARHLAEMRQDMAQVENVNLPSPEAVAATAAQASADAEAGAKEAEADVAGATPPEGNGAAGDGGTALAGFLSEMKTEPFKAPQE